MRGYIRHAGNGMVTDERLWHRIRIARYDVRCLPTLDALLPQRRSERCHDRRSVVDRCHLQVSGGDEIRWTNTLMTPVRITFLELEYVLDKLSCRNNVGGHFYSGAETPSYRTKAPACVLTNPGRFVISSYRPMQVGSPQRRNRPIRAGSGRSGFRTSHAERIYRCCTTGVRKDPCIDAQTRTAVAVREPRERVGMCPEFTC